MGLTSVLVDHARTIRQQRTGEKVEGQPQIIPQVSEWFRCRIEQAETSQQADDGHWYRVARTSVITSKYDSKRDLLEILATDYIQVVSSDVDTGEDTIWQVSGDVVPMRRRRGILGFYFNVDQVRESPTWMRELPPGLPQF